MHACPPASLVPGALWGVTMTKRTRCCHAFLRRLSRFVGDALVAGCVVCFTRVLPLLMLGLCCMYLPSDLGTVSHCGSGSDSVSAQYHCTLCHPRLRLCAFVPLRLCAFARVCMCAPFGIAGSCGVQTLDGVDCHQTLRREESRLLARFQASLVIAAQEQVRGWGAGAGATNSLSRACGCRNRKSVNAVCCGPSSSSSWTRRAT